jgi:hypothetical protein
MLKFSDGQTPYIWHLTLKDDLSPIKNVQLHEVHTHAKYQVSIFNNAKVMANVEVFFPDGRTDWHTYW